MERTLAGAAVTVPGARLLVVAARYYEDIVDQLTLGALRAIETAEATAEVVEGPGALEVPGMIAAAARAGKFDGYVALGCVIRGETTHYDIVSMQSARALMDLTVRKRLAIGNGILTVENEAQALERADPSRGDKGGEAARACLCVVAFARRFSK